MNNLAILIFLILLSTNAFSNNFKASVIGVNDGDTLKVINDKNKQLKIRLYGIDCPEKNQAFGNQAKMFTSKLIFKKQILIKKITTDQYNRIVALVYFDDICLNEILLAYGYAWIYPQYCKEPYKSQWIKYENYAKINNLGLWSENSPTPPWEYRKKPPAKLINYFPKIIEEKIIIIIIIILTLAIIIFKSIIKNKTK